MKKENVVPDVFKMMVKKILEKITASEIRRYFGNDLEPDMHDEDVKEYFAKWLNEGVWRIPKLYKLFVEVPQVEETTVIRTRVVELPELNLSAVVESRINYVEGTENYEQSVVNIEINGEEYEVDNDVEDAIFSLL